MSSQSDGMTHKQECNGAHAFFSALIVNRIIHRNQTINKDFHFQKQILTKHISAPGSVLGVEDTVLRQEFSRLGGEQEREKGVIQSACAKAKR